MGVAGDDQAGGPLLCKFGHDCSERHDASARQAVGAVEREQTQYGGGLMHLDGEKRFTRIAVADPTQSRVTNAGSEGSGFDHVGQVFAVVCQLEAAEAHGLADDSVRLGIAREAGDPLHADVELAGVNQRCGNTSTRPACG